MKYKSRKGVVLCEIAGQYMLIAAQHLRKEVPYITALNETGAFCWKCLENGADENELCSKMNEEYDTGPEERLRKDIQILISQLLKYNYIQEA